jgi:hypothetical protein
VAALTSWAQGYALGMDKYGKAGGQTLANMYGALFDPGQLHLTAAKIWDYAQTVPSSTFNNGSYLLQALAAPFTVQGLQNIYDDNMALAGKVMTALGQAAVGVGPLLVQYGKQYVHDPVGAVSSTFNELGGASWTAFESSATAVLGDAGLKGVATLGTKVVSRGVGVFTTGAAVDTGVVDATSVVGAGVSDARASEAMAQRMLQAQQVIDNYQTLPAGTVLDVATVTGKGGLLAEDATAIQGVIKGANTKFGIEFELAARTSEPLSAGIVGRAKPEFVKGKAVGILDQMMGADPARAGMVGLFDPVPIDPGVVATLDAANPGFAAKYSERFASQKKLYADEWLDPNSKLRVLVDAGARYKNTGGITVLNARPGNPIPYGLKYLEQLDEPAFQAANMIDPANVPAIRNDILTRTNIDTFKAAPVASVSAKGTVFIDDALSGTPFVSDLDIQSVAPKNGVWPAGVSRGQVETYFKAELSKLQRFPFHGWSDAAVDLPSDYYMNAASFQLGNADPTLAAQAANLVAGRLQLLEQLATTKAAKLIAAGDTAGANKVLAPFTKIADLKDPVSGLYSPAKLLAKYPPGEKTINFTAGDIRVGYGTGGK